MIEIKEIDKKLKNYKFIDLFAGIGGFHYALKSFGAECVFASEIDKKASDIYELNHKLKPFGDITKINVKDIPKHDILCGGFPCQAFSISGKQKGFQDTRGTLFFDIARIVNHHKPKILFLENVKNFGRHDNGNTLKVVIETLNKMDYTVYHKVLNTSDFGLPQNRERIYIIAFNNVEIKNINFAYPYQKIISSLTNILEHNPDDGKIIEREDVEFCKEYNPINNIFGEIDLPNKPIQIGKVNKGGQGERIYHPLGHSITLSAYGGGVGSKTGIYKINGKIRKLSPRECARLQGYPESFTFHKSISEAHKQFGNSVSVNVLQYLLKEVVQVIKANEEKTEIRFRNCKARVQERERNSLQV
ncbi:MAG: DNA cytosine methyltransferase [Ignavibacteriae bacterium]|nr:DNA cytosine methyltransferase [Ignavibacteriota bacterium]